MNGSAVARRTVVVVEDNADNRLLVGAILERLYTVVPYPSGQDAILGCHESPPDLVLLDISLPGMDGTEVLRLLRADPLMANVPVLALTADATPGARDRYLALGFEDYIAKPILNAQDLRDAVERQLRS
mgnify:CR=1 FL=1